MRPAAILLTALLCAGCSVTTQSFGRSDRLRVHLVRLPVSNVYAVEADGHAMLVDAGDPGQETEILAALERTEVPAGSVRLIVLTHGHADHAGSAAALSQALEVPVAVQRADVEITNRGQNPPLHPTNLTAELLRLFLVQEYPPFDPELAFERCLDLHPYGLPGVVRSAPGHTAGSSVVLLDNGDAIVGDVMLGGYLGGLLSPHVPTEHYYQEHPRRVRSIVEWLLDLGVRRFFVGHGGPLGAFDVRTAIEGGDLGPGEDTPFEPPPCDAPELR